MSAHYKTLLKTLLNASEPELLTLVLGFKQQGLSLSELYDEIINPAMRRVGELWEKGALSIAEEHRASAKISRVVSTMRERATRNPTHDKSALVACVEGELHDLPARMFSDLLYLDGWDVDYLGANTPTQTLVDFVSVSELSLVVLSIALEQSRATLQKTIESLNALTPSPFVLVGGRNGAGMRGARHVRSLSEALSISRRVVDAEHGLTPLEQLLSSFGARVSDARKSRSWTQAELATRAKLDRTYVGAVERGKQNLSLGAVVKISNALGLALDELLAGHVLTPPLP